MAEALLQVQGFKKHFPVTRGWREERVLVRAGGVDSRSAGGNPGAGGNQGAARPRWEAHSQMIDPTEGGSVWGKTWPLERSAS
jgi:hypothetical protein